MQAGTACWPNTATWAALRAGTDAGNEYAAVQTGQALARARRLERGRRDPGRAPATSRPPGSWPRPAGSSAATWTDSAPGLTSATSLLPGGWREVLAEQGRREEAGRLRRFGLNVDGSIADARENTPDRSGPSAHPPGGRAAYG